MCYCFHFISSLKINMHFISLLFSKKEGAF